MSRPIHVHHVLLSLAPGGLENGVVNVVNQLAPQHFRSSVCCLQGGGAFASRIAANVTIQEMGLQKGNDLRLPWKLARLFRASRPDIVHTRNAEAFFYGLLGARLAGVRCVVHSEHGRNFDDRAVRLLAQRWCSRAASGVFAVSSQLKRDLVQHVGLPAAAIDVLWNGVDTSRFGSATATQGATVRQRLGIGADALVVGSVGRLVSVKNYGLLLQAVATLALPALQVLQVLLVGDGPERDALQRQATALGIAGRVLFCGHRDDVGTMLSAMDVFVLPSHSEGMSNTLLEAMAAGVPCVVSDVGGNPEIVHSERDGLVFASDSVAALQTCLQRLGADAALRQRLAQAGQARIARDFTLAAMIGRYEAFYRRALGTDGR